MSEFSVKIEVSRNFAKKEITANYGENLRRVLIRFRLSPHVGVWKKLNCKGNGICGSCQIFVQEGDQFWLRRSCQIRCFRPMKLKLESA